MQRTALAAIVRTCLAAACLMLVQAPAPADVVTRYLEPFPDIEQDPYQMYWNDITGTAYTQDFIDDFSYDNATVRLDYSSFDPYHFSGSLYATGLKPNFCYQIKLNGKPEDYYGSDGDDASNEDIGYMGRWWREEPNPDNANDAEYEANRDDPSYVYSGYLLFDFFVTDDTGAATVDFSSDSSYHVVWRESQRGHGANDGPVRYYTVDGTEVGLYAERQQTRALPGELALTPGAYNVQFRLTEESFHDYPAFWAQVLRCDDVHFAIAPEPATSAMFLLGAVLLACRVRRRIPPPSQERNGHPHRPDAL